MDLCDICRLAMPGDHPCCLSLWIKVVSESFSYFQLRLAEKKLLGLPRDGLTTTSGPPSLEIV